MNRLQLLVALIWLTAFGRGFWRLILAVEGTLEFRADWALRWDWWPAYVDFWQVAGTCCALFLFIVNWRAIEWR